MPEGCTVTFSIEQTPNLSGKVALVTGGNGGLGFETVKAIASRGAHCVIAARNVEKAEQARVTLLQTLPGASLEVMQLDLASLASIEAMASHFRSRHQQLDLLVNNAGLMAMPESRTVDGFETQFGVNHLGHWALTGRLMPALKRAHNPRVVTVTSSAHHMAFRINFADPHLRKRYSAWGAYSQSKLANYYFALGLHRMAKASGSPIQSLLAHPGFSQTNLQVETVKQGGGGRMGDWSLYLVNTIGMTAEVGVMPQVRAALDPSAKSGEFYCPKYLSSGPPIARGYWRPGANRIIRKLWELSERETGVAVEI